MLLWSAANLATLLNGKKGMYKEWRTLQALSGKARARIELILIH
ncbi:MAG TPA: hypothetical protein PLL06_22865 [Acidobacteriota bacterium]|nr:hypothetical protein [Acidobacteriota bacterium]HNC42722.1 hypothetical protein [Acidobacteriota bacterium]